MVKHPAAEFMGKQLVLSAMYPTISELCVVRSIVGQAQACDGLVTGAAEHRRILQLATRL